MWISLCKTYQTLQHPYWVKMMLNKKICLRPVHILFYRYTVMANSKDTLHPMTMIWVKY